ncbi:MAG: ATP-binding cassette domain-containing protein [Lachnospiraceae bacterium]|jgi:molybdate transport system ATP-binding protein|nr:ATP-binding cassette domain-containing protein [Lachnospiraceae bacterium]
MAIKVDIKKKHKGFCLRVSFESSNGMLGILGASGSGKSMTLKCIAGLENPDGGHISIDGRVLFDSDKKINLRPQERAVGYMFQNYALFPHMNVYRNLRCAIKPDKKESINSRIDSLLREFSLMGMSKRLPSQLSGGQQQRVALARLFASNPKCLLLDEPFSALDSHLRERFQVEMKERLGDFGADVIMVTHDRDEAYKMCESLLVLEEGRPVAFGATKDIFSKPETVAAARITGCKNIVPIVKLNSHKVKVPDWGMELELKQEVSEKHTHIGIRAHDFHGVSQSGLNTVSVNNGEIMEGPFEWNVLFETTQETGGESKVYLWWKIAKTGDALQMPQYLCVNPEDVQLLKE